MLLYNQVKGSEFPKKENKQVKENKTMMKTFEEEMKEMGMEILSDTEETCGLSEETLSEMRNVFGKGQTVVNILTGKRVRL